MDKTLGSGEDSSLSYAVTNLQLFNQLISHGLATEDLQRIKNTYELARLLFSGRFTASGRSQLAHCVRTASILASWHAPPHVIAAGLIHNVYKNGDFGDGTRKISGPKKTVLQDLLGQDIETEAANFVRIKWNEHNVSLFKRGEGPLTRNTVLLRLADGLEHNLDGGLFYDHKAMQRRRGTEPWILEAAKCLEIPGLVEELEKLKLVQESHSPLAEFHEKFGAYGGSDVLPPSCSRKFSLKLLHVFHSWLPGRGQTWFIRRLRRLIQHGRV